MQPEATQQHRRERDLRDRFIGALDAGLRTVFVPTRAARQSPSATQSPVELDEADRRQAAALMRVNHVGEICAQALYQSQALFSRTESLRHHFEQAGFRAVFKP